jgi:hypothetical protein
MQDLGTFHGNPVTGIACCNTLNNSGDAVGVTADTSGNMTAILWRDSVFTDLNTLVSADSPLYLQGSSSINDSSQIVGNGIVKSSCPPDDSAGIAGMASQPGCLQGISRISRDPR